MAYYAVVDDFRDAVPHTVLASGVLRPRGLAGHTTEGGEGEAGFLATVEKVLIGMPERSAGYHEGWYPKNGGFEARRVTRPEHAAHSMNPRQPPWRNPPLERVRRILGDRWWDPNAVSYAVSIAGSTGVTVPKLIRDSGFMVGARRRYAELLAQFPSLSPDPLFNHGEGQADRSDWGLLMRPAILEDDTVTLANMEPLFGQVATLAEGATARRTPAFDRNDYDAGKLFTLGAPSSAPALGWVQGTNLTLAVGAVFDVRTRWLATWNKDHGIVFWHERDVVGLKASAATDAEIARLAGALDTANKRTASVKTSAAAFLRKGATANRDTAAGLEAAAKNVESL